MWIRGEDLGRVGEGNCNQNILYEEKKNISIKKKTLATTTKRTHQKPNGQHI